MSYPADEGLAVLDFCEEQKIFKGFNWLSSQQQVFPSLGSLLDSVLEMVKQFSSFGTKHESLQRYILADWNSGLEAENAYQTLKLWIKHALADKKELFGLAQLTSEYLNSKLCRIPDRHETLILLHSRRI